MPWQPVSLQWPGDRAVLLVHGIGNTETGGGEAIGAAVRAALGTDADDIAIYQFYYDGINDWFMEKTQAAAMVNPLVQLFKHGGSGDALSQTIADYAGDVLWPVLSVAARSAVRQAYIQQLLQMVRDGATAGFTADQLRMTIITHSLGCFHTYETLHEICRNPLYTLQPATHHVTFENVIVMASPVKLIRTVAGEMGGAVPDPASLATLRGPALSIPSQRPMAGAEVRVTPNWVSITGDLDPVGGHALRKKLDRAYADIPGQVSIIDSQAALNIGGENDLAGALRASLRDRKPPAITVNDPHSWTAYVDRHAADLRGWVA
jgi:hypothetical protein